MIYLGEDLFIGTIWRGEFGLLTLPEISSSRQANGDGEAIETRLS